MKNIKEYLVNESIYDDLLKAEELLGNVFKDLNDEKTIKNYIYQIWGVLVKRPKIESYLLDYAEKELKNNKRI